ncbi:MAG TPA: IS701 family transposase [bacterium]|nr:IS701 family transposase [bacterium]
MRLRAIHRRYAPCYKTCTRDTSRYAFTYLRGLLSMPDQRNYANIARRVLDPDADGQNLQQFMSDSPWSAQSVFDQVQRDVLARPELHGGVLTVDESGDERSGDQSAGAAQQYLGREGKTDMGQVGVTLGYYKPGTWLMVDAELYLPQAWFDEAHADLRRRWHVPSERGFATKPQLALAMIRHARANGLPFALLTCDSTYGGNEAFRAALDAEEIPYIADVAQDTPVYLRQPVVGVPPTPPGKPGRPFSRVQVLEENTPVLLRDLAADPSLRWEHILVRDAERGPLLYECSARRVWTLGTGGLARQEWLLLHRQAGGEIKFSFSNAPADTPLSWLATGRADRYFAERIYQDAKSEAGWDELVARKYRAWMHHAALDAVALFYIAETKLDWAREWPRDPELVEQLHLHVLPALSMANVRELLRAALPLPRLSEEQALRLVAKHLFNRSKSKASRIRKRAADDTS